MTMRWLLFAFLVPGVAFALGEERHTATGRVVDEAGRPVAGAEIQIVDALDQDEGAPRRTRTGRAGRFRFDQVPEGDYLVVVEHPSHAPFWEVRAVEGGDLGTLVLHPGVRLTGMVTDRDGRTVAGHPVEASFHWRSGGPRPKVVRTGPDGSFALEHAPSAGVVLDACGEGYVARRVVVEHPEEPVHLTVEPAARSETRPAVDDPWELLARSLDRTSCLPLPETTPPSGSVDSGRIEVAPVQGRVTGSALGAAITGRILGLAAGEPGPDDRVWLDQRNGPLLTAAIRSDGTFKVRQVPHGTWDLSVVVSEREARSTVVLPPGQSEIRADLVLPPVHPVTGRVVDELGRPLARAEILAWWEGRLSVTSGTTRADGSFLLHLPDRRYRLIVRKEGFQEGELPSLQVQGGPVTGLEIRLQRAVVPSPGPGFSGAIPAPDGARPGRAERRRSP